MKEPTFLQYMIIVSASILFALLGLYLLSNFGRLFRGIRNEWLRKNALAWLIICCFILATTPLNGDFFRMMQNHGVWAAILGQMIIITLHTLIVFNLVRLIDRNVKLRTRLSFVQHKILVILVLVACVVLVNTHLIWVFGDIRKGLKYTILTSIYFGSATGLVYVFMSYLDLERQKKFDEKELELSRLRELKTKAELDALHSKVNPHFLYNALNSIADLSITDGKKARKMTIALADLFRYSINYSHNNYSTVRDEVAMIEVYLEIEKVRFEDQLNYSIHIDEEAAHYLIPRFILQPLAENAVKHGLKATGKFTKIHLEVRVEGGDRLVLTMQDNGLPFPSELMPGYGVKSVYDKLDLLFPNQYEVHFNNEPTKQVVIYILKLIKNEPGL